MYGNVRNLLSRNIGAVTARRPAGLCARALYAPGLDIFAIQPEFDVHLLTSMVRWLFWVSTVRVTAVARLLGPDLALNLINAYMATGLRPSIREVVGIATARISELIGAPVSIPFVFMKVEDDTALCGPFPRTLVTAAEWYGDALYTS